MPAGEIARARAKGQIANASAVRRPAPSAIRSGRGYQPVTIWTGSAGARSARSSQGAACPSARPKRLPIPASTRICSR